MKAEIIKALKQVEHTFDWFTPEGDEFTSDTKSFEIETENYYIDLEVEVLVRFTAYDEYEMDELNVIDWMVSNKRTNELLIDGTFKTITEEEIKNLIDIQL